MKSGFCRHTQSNFYTTETEHKFRGTLMSCFRSNLTMNRMCFIFDENRSKENITHWLRSCLCFNLSAVGQKFSRWCHKSIKILQKIRSRGVPRTKGMETLSTDWRAYVCRCIHPRSRHHFWAMLAQILPNWWVLEDNILACSQITQIKRYGITHYWYTKLTRKKGELFQGFEKLPCPGATCKKPFFFSIKFLNKSQSGTVELLLQQCIN